MKIFILWALLKTGQWIPMHTFDGNDLAQCNAFVERYGHDKELMDRANAVLLVCLPPSVKPSSLRPHGA